MIIHFKKIQKTVSIENSIITCLDKINALYANINLLIFCIIFEKSIFSKIVNNYLNNMIIYIHRNINFWFLLIWLFQYNLSPRRRHHHELYEI